MVGRIIVLFCALAVLLSGTALAQQQRVAVAAPAEFAYPAPVAEAPGSNAVPGPASAPENLLESALRRTTVAKWATLAGSIGVGALGLQRHQQAQGKYDELERLCLADRQACAERLPNGAFADAGLEALYQEVRSLDRGARSFMIAGQAGVVASVALFILDLRAEGSPPNVIFEPKGFNVMLSPQLDGSVVLRATLPAGPARR